MEFKQIDPTYWKCTLDQEEELKLSKVLDSIYNQGNTELYTAYKHSIHYMLLSRYITNKFIDLYIDTFNTFIKIDVLYSKKTIPISVGKLHHGDEFKIVDGVL